MSNPTPSSPSQDAAMEIADAYPKARVYHQFEGRFWFYGMGNWYFEDALGYAVECPHPESKVSGCSDCVLLSVQSKAAAIAKLKAVLPPNRLPAPQSNQANDTVVGKIREANQIANNRQLTADSRMPQIRALLREALALLDTSPASTDTAAAQPILCHCKLPTIRLGFPDVCDFCLGVISQSHPAPDAPAKEPENISLNKIRHAMEEAEYMKHPETGEEGVFLAKSDADAINNVLDELPDNSVSGVVAVATTSNDVCPTCNGTGEITDPNHPDHPTITKDGSDQTWCIDCDGNGTKAAYRKKCAEREVAPAEAQSKATLREVADELLAACKARVAFDAKVAAEPGVDDGPLSPSRIEELAREQAGVTVQMVKAIARAESIREVKP